MPITIDGTNGITQAGEFNSDSSFGFKNRIINGAMVIDQRNAGASVTANNGVFGVDRFKISATQSSKGTMQQNAGSVTPPAGFTNYLGLTSSSAFTPASGDLIALLHRVEGFNSADLAWGTASAKTVTLSFWVYSSLTGTFGGGLGNSDGSYTYPFNYTISAANTWEQKTITITGATSGTWTADNSTGINISWSLATGSTYSGTAGAWTSGVNAYNATGATQPFSTNGATFYITGVQLEIGSTATSFDYRPYTTELQLAQRYFCTSYVYGTAVGTITGNGAVRRWTDAGSVFASVQIVYPVSMRAAPSVTIYGTAAGGTSGQVSGDGRNVSGAVGGTSSTLYSFAYANNVSIGTNEGIGCNFTASAEL
jgi:hypothetical protein